MNSNPNRPLRARTVVFPSKYAALTPKQFEVIRRMEPQGRMRRVESLF
jgi:hypothetical protein